MEIRLRPALLQEVINSLPKTEREGDPTSTRNSIGGSTRFMRSSPSKTEFKKLYQYLFGIWGFSDIVRDSFHEYSLLREKVGVRPGQGRAEGR